jgi:hypothetical protein
MPEKRVRDRAKKDEAAGKAPSTQAGEFVRDEIHHVREGRHGARSTKQAIAIGLSKARRAGVRLPPPKKGRVPEETRLQAKRESARGRRKTRRPPARRRSRATLGALRREGHSAASHEALATQGRSAAARRRPSERSRAARKAGATKRRREHATGSRGR